MIYSFYVIIMSYLLLLYHKELAHVITEAEKAHDLPSTS